ncbi:TonB-dependent copper receptor [Acinetobacter baumannii]|uniref:TonB-dependent copper receptor n=1 Tax=Acinetobacter baumannii TaxID=470 RepID=UPI001FD6E86B|nr:TonB-dependent copper receptor [Acinetobacter baumannii]EKV4527083.1 TonB-dependent copper receptor [Acinetobacter baumannii]MCT9417955.1 TonB-dependent copper receptor [Acinetobacter baumannii]MCW1491007.1 TonB-dependent copper receptor [Acinetobacter baumannii]MDC4796798.1 TonB-dependent copper receptor [Acinetobacter baumannii]MDC5064848.1 TonB-dependent copper receptor [Acinetobacter baumannii]
MPHSKFLLQPLWVAMLAVSHSGLVFAESEKNDAETNTLHSLAPIVVTAQQGNDANGLIVHADPKQPIQPVPATDGADYLQSIMGFNSIQSGGTNGDVTFRGMFGSRIKILTDGTENLGACPNRMDAPTSYISPESYDRISVIKGPQTVQYANTGSAATVLFERQPEKLTSEKPYRGQASVLLGSYGRIDHNVEAAIGDEKKYIRLNANRSESNSYQDGDGNTVPSAWKKWNADVALGFTPDENSWVEITGGKSDGESLYAGRSMDGSQFARESLGLRFEKKNITDVIKKIEGQVNYSYNDHIMDNFSLRQPELKHDHETHEMYLDKSAMQVTRRTLNSRLAMTTEWNKWSLITGVDSQFNKHGGSMSSPKMNMPFSQDMRFQSYGAFGELGYQWNDLNKLVTGVRVDRVRVEDERTESKGFNTKLEKTLPSAFVRWENQRPDLDFKSYIGLGYVERMPDYWELFSPEHGNAGSTNTFNGVNPEKTLQLDLGFQQQHGALNIWASAYAGLVDDYILMNYHDHSHLHPNEHGGHGSHGITPGAKNVDATIAGAEAGIGYQFTDHIQADLSAMYAWGKNTTDDKPLPQISPLEGRLNIRYVADKYNLGLLWRAVAEQNRVSLHQGNIVGYDLKPSKGFSTLSLNGSYNLRKDIDVSVGIDNVLDKTYTEHLNKAGSAGFGFASEEQFNNIGRNYWVRMSMKF